MNDSMGSLSTNDSQEGQERKKKKSNAILKKTVRPINISYNEVVQLLNPQNFFINKNLEEQFNVIQIVHETSYFPYFKFIFDENLVCSERKWDRLPTMIRLTS
ncbi:unnamed protein product [Paramecium octaurelia]|uniref:Uncharacterized protein n=1 Tax=Paramecium octaurelia TaxID=43137 RepID=A0A8S1U4D0_PAROT|nr:unnamed protein product [Paramecium octaurelia]